MAHGRGRGCRVRVRSRIELLGGWLMTRMTCKSHDSMHGSQAAATTLQSQPSTQAEAVREVRTASAG